MNFTKTFLKLTEYTTPFGYEDTLEKYLPYGYKKDSIGNYYYVIGESETIFTSHLDNACEKRESINHILLGDIIKTDGKTILGADNKAGCLVLFYMIKNKVPGVYYFFIGEETSVHKNLPYGSILAIQKYKKFFNKFKRIISFDRKEKGQLVNRQLGRKCCSDEFSKFLIDEFSKNGISYDIDSTGYYTDSAFFSNIIPEVVNLSIGVYNEHTKNEYVDIKYVECVAKASINIKWDKLPTERKIDNKYDVDDVDDLVENIDNDDKRIFKKIFTLLDDMYFVCHEIRSYHNFINKFKSGRLYHFTKWHEDIDIDLSIKDGYITSNGVVYSNIDSFKKSIGIEILKKDELLKLTINKFIGSNNKMSDADVNFLMYQKGDGADIVELFKDSGYKINKIGKGYEIFKESYIFNKIDKYKKYKKL